MVREGRGSVSLLQRALGIGYGRAARLIDFMAEDGIVGPYNGSQAREVLITLEQWEAMSGASVEALPAPTPSRPRRNRILPDADDDEGGEDTGDELSHERDDDAPFDDEEPAESDEDACDDDEPEDDDSEVADDYDEEEAEDSSYDEDEYKAEIA